MITINPNNNKAYATKAFLKKASIYGSREYKLLREFKLENPEIEVTAKTRRKAVCKNRNATYEYMREYLNTLPKSDRKKAIEEFERVLIQSKLQRSPYKFVLDWFNETYPNGRPTKDEEENKTSKTDACNTFEAEEVNETFEAEDVAA